MWNHNHNSCPVGCKIVINVNKHEYCNWRRKEMWEGYTASGQYEKNWILETLTRFVFVQGIKRKKS